MSQELVLLQKEDNGVAKIILNAPPLNLMTVAMNHRLDHILDEVADDKHIGVVVLTGAGQKAFSAGADIKEFSQFIQQGTMVSKKLEFECAVLDKLEALPQPTIAALNGITLGGGMEMALCCDFILMADHIQIGFPEIKLGLFPGSGGLIRLPKRIGKQKSKELLFWGKMISAAEALTLGLADEILPAEEVLPRALSLAEELSNMPWGSLRAIKRGIDDIMELHSAYATQYSLGLMSRILTTEDAREGVDAFIQKRQAHFNKM